MKTPITLLALVALLAIGSQAQQPPQPQPAPTQPQAAPCATTPTPQPPKGLHFNLPKGLQQAIDKQRQKIQNQTGITIPSAQDLTNQAKQAMSPCGKAPAPVPAPAPAPQTPAKPADSLTNTPPKIPASAIPIPVDPPANMIAFACLKGANLKLLPGYAYCVDPSDHATAPAVLFPGMTMPPGYELQTPPAPSSTTPRPKAGAQ